MCYGKAGAGDFNLALFCERQIFFCPKSPPVDGEGIKQKLSYWYTLPNEQQVSKQMDADTGLFEIRYLITYLVRGENKIYDATHASVLSFAVQK